MKAKAGTICLGLAALAGLAWAAQSSVTFADKGGNMVLRNFRSWKSTLAAKDTIRFIGIGSPLSGSWKEQGLTVTARQIDGIAKGEGGRYALSTATITGDVRLVKEGGGQRVTVESESIKLTSGATAMRADLSGGVTIDSTGPRAGESTRITGTSGWMMLDATGKGNQMVRTAELSGGVRIVSRRSSDKGPVNINARGQRLEVDNVSTPAELTLIGNVEITGNDPALAGDVKGVSRAIIRLDANRQPIEIELIGDPTGTTTVRDTGGSRPR